MPVEGVATARTLPLFHFGTEQLTPRQLFSHDRLDDRNLQRCSHFGLSSDRLQSRHLVGAHGASLEIFDIIPTPNKNVFVPASEHHANSLPCPDHVHARRALGSKCSAFKITTEAADLNIIQADRKIPKIPITQRPKVKDTKSLPA